MTARPDIPWRDLQTHRHHQLTRRCPCIAGVVDDVYGHDFSGNCSGPDGSCNVCGGRPLQAASSTHGTHVAGIVGAIQNNAMGITGVAPGVKLMILRVRLWVTHA